MKNFFFPLPFCIELKIKTTSKKHSSFVKGGNYSNTDPDFKLFTDKGMQFWDMRCCLDIYIDVCVYNNMWISGTEQTCPGNYWCTYYRLSIDIPTTQRDRISSLDEKFLFSSSSAEQGWLDRFSHDTHYVFVVFEGESISISERFQINLSLQALFIRPLKNTFKMSSKLHKKSHLFIFGAQN